MNKKAQLAPFMVLVIAILILAISATVLIGELGFQRIRLANVADSAIISAGSSLCRSLNQIRLIHKQMFLNYFQLQAALLAKLLWPDKATAYKYASGWAAAGWLKNKELFDQAEKLAENATKDLRSSLYDTCFGSALIDEPKPFLEDEVFLDRSLNYTKYLKRDSKFTSAYRDLKKNNPNAWFSPDVLSYSFNRSKDKVLKTPGQFSNEPFSEFESSLRVQLQDVPGEIKVKEQKMVLTFFYKIEKPPYVMIGFMPHLWAWIRKINIDSNSFGLNLSKNIPFTRFPFFSRNKVNLSQTSRIKLQGKIWKSYSFRMKQ